MSERYETLTSRIDGRFGEKVRRVPSICGELTYEVDKDDLIETFFLNVFYGASISTMLPIQLFFGGEIIVIRPLYLADENLIKRYTAFMGWQPLELGCPTAGSSKREEVRGILQRLYRSNRKIKGNIFHALQNVRLEYLP